MPNYIDSIDPTGLLDGYAEQLDFTQDEEHTTMASHIRENYEFAYNNRLGYETKWEQYRLYLKGDQLLYRIGDTHEIVRIEDPDNRRMYSINNQCRPAARALTGKLSRMVPAFSLVPATQDEDEVHGARAGDAFMQYFRNKEKLDLKYVEMQQNLMWAGNSVAQVYWNPQTGRKLAACLAPDCGYTGDVSEIDIECPHCQMMNQQMMQQYEQMSAQYEQASMAAQMMGQPPPEQPEPPPQEVPQLEEVYEGDVKVCTRDIRDVYVEPGAETPEEANWIVVRTSEPIQTIRRRFPIMGGFLEPESDVYAERVARRLYNVQTETWAAEELRDHAYLYEYHEAPTELYSKGRVIWMCNDIILEETEGLYDILNRLPFYWNCWQRNPGEYWAEAPMEHAWHRQRELNQLETQLREFAELLAKPKTLIPFGTQIGSDEISAVTGQLIYYNGAAGEPHFMDAPSFPSMVFARRAEIVEDIRLQFAVTGTEAGAASADPNGRAMAIEEAESDQQVGPIIAYNVSEWGELYRGVIMLAREYYSPERKFQIRGEDGWFEVYSFEDLSLSPGWDLQLEIDDGFSKNAAIRQQQVANWVNMGLFTDMQTGQMDIARIAKTAKIKIPGVGVDTNSGEAARAMKMIRDIETGGGDPASLPQMQIWDNPKVFSDIFLRWLRTKGSKQLTTDPQLVQTVQFYWQTYTQWMATMMMPEQPSAVLSGQGGQSQPGQEQSAPGGSPNSAVGSDADAMVKNADSQAEGQARISSNHEG